MDADETMTERPIKSSKVAVEMKDMSTVVAGCHGEGQPSTLEEADKLNNAIVRFARNDLYAALIALPAGWAVWGHAKQVNTKLRADVESVALMRAIVAESNVIASMLQTLNDIIKDKLELVSVMVKSVITAEYLDGICRGIFQRLLALYFTGSADATKEQKVAFREEPGVLQTCIALHNLHDHTQNDVGFYSAAQEVAVFKDDVDNLDAKSLSAESAARTLNGAKDYKGNGGYDLH